MATLNDLTAGEMAMAERTAGMSIATLEDPNYPKVGLLGAMAWVLAKRDDVKLKYDDFMNSNTLEQITESLGLNDDEEGN